jgi:G3E family GTPase
MNKSQVMIREGRFDYFLVESTGISEPLPVAATSAGSQEPFCIREIGCAEAFREPVVNVRDDAARLVAFAVLSPEPTQTHGSAKFK